MSVPELISVYQNHSHAASFVSWFNDVALRTLKLKGLCGSSRSLFAAHCISVSKGVHWVIIPDREEAAYFYNDLTHAIDEETVMFFPSAYKRSVTQNEIDEAGLILRTSVLNNLKQLVGKEGSLVIVSYPEALMEKVVTSESLDRNTLVLTVGEKISISFIREVLEEYRFEETEFVYEPGQFSVRGSIVDIFSYSNHLPYRIDFFGDEVETIRTFDVEDQLSRDKFGNISIVPNIQKLIGEDKGDSVLKLLPPSSVIWSENLKLCIDRIDEVYCNAPEKLVSELSDEKILRNQVLIEASDVAQILGDFRHVEFGQTNYYNPKRELEFSTSPQPVFNKNFELLSENLADYRSKSYELYLLSENPKQIDRLKDIFKSLSQKIAFNPIINSVHEGFIDNDLKICYYTDHQIFERYHKYRINRQFVRSDTITLNELRGLQTGDYVVHIDHGIGVFGGLGKIDVNGHYQEAIRLIYRDNDVLYVNIHNLHKISKYRGKDGEQPKIYKLGTPAWQNMKQTTKRKVKDIARELIALYAKRKESPGFAFSPDTYMQEELEASFIYEDTPDQEKATAAVKRSMEEPYPMDHLVCGDVGFGKTEVAIRAAFKAVADNKQVAILVPTTILALQHYNTIKDRLEKYPCTVDYISRLKTAKNQKETLKNLEAGKVDIVVGTHRLIGKDVKFKNLGLLIIDEEQKFGVSAKEKLKALRVNVDTLTMTATPIPRTLQFSLMGARDLSIIATPPPNRHPIQTELHTFNDKVIQEAIDFEVSRGGQVFFINNRVDSLPQIEQLINKLCPKVKTVFAHGQMDGERLEQIMLEFMRGDFDVLIATTIIESGVDISNANTIIINQAQNFGLSDLHQLRGRVGRSNKKAFCYLLAPPYSVLTPEARRRLKAIEEFSELGSGFSIAMQDLDIRGAGNMLGAEQSGFISDIGFETYQRILNEAMLELRETEFQGIFDDENEKQETFKVEDFVADCQVDTDFELMFPDAYVRNVSERIRLYRELDNVENEEKLKEFEQHLIDRFGPLPLPTLELFNVVRLRWLAKQLGFEKIILKNGKMLIWFVANQQSPYYQSPIFGKIIHFVQKNPRLFQMKEAKNKLTMSSEPVETIEEALVLLNKILAL
ncbi:MAG: transcription-repair coupling factor [Bacteroidota bacterium]|nr:transcription-repair coupling factor [Bacteroidota bacterium]